MSLFNARLESSILPPIEITDSDILPSSLTGISGAPNGGAPLYSPQNTLMMLIRPKAILQSEFISGSKTIAKYGEPIPWQIGLAIFVLIISFVGHVVWSALLGRKSV